MTRSFLLQPVDAWFFRDGRPYNQSESNQTGVVSLFPPHAPTVLGALRAALARANGWGGDGSWTRVPGLESILGNGPSALGALRFRGPYLARRASDGTHELLWPLPAHVLGVHAADTWRPETLLTPSANTVPSDIGDVHVPVPAHGRAAASKLTGTAPTWVTSKGLSAIVEGRIPEVDQIVPASALWRHELRVGIRREQDTRTTGPNAMYSPLMIRLRRDVALAAELGGIPASWNPPSEYIPLGGEARLASCTSRAISLEVSRPPIEHIRRTRRLIVVHLAPARFARLPVPGSAMPDMPGTRVVCACLPSPTWIGGWSSIDRGPVALTPHVAAGSVWFCQLDRDAVERVLCLHDTYVGEHRAHGFGHIVLGAWPEPHENIQSRKLCPQCQCQAPISAAAPVRCELVLLEAKCKKATPSPAVLRPQPFPQPFH